MRSCKVLEVTLNFFTHLKSSLIANKDSQSFKTILKVKITDGHFVIYLFI